MIGDHALLKLKMFPTESPFCYPHWGYKGDLSEVPDSELTVTREKRKLESWSRFHQVAEFRFWIPFGHSVGNDLWPHCAVLFREVDPFCLCFLISWLVHNVECDWCSAVFHQLHNLKIKKKGTKEDVFDPGLSRRRYEELTSVWDSPSTNVPLTRMMRSPSLMPASSAGPPISRERIRWPSSPSSILKKKPKVCLGFLVREITLGLYAAMSENKTKNITHQFRKNINRET